MAEHPRHIKIGLRIFTGIIILALVFVGGVYVGYANRPASDKISNLINKEAGASEGVTDFEPFWKAWKLVDDKFPGAEETDSKERMYGAIKGMLASFGDPYTTFFSPEESEEFETQISGEFSGVGVEIGVKDGILTVIAPLKDTPAFRAGIKPGDKIVKIGDQITSDMTIDKAIELIRGQDGTQVTLTIIREESPEPKVFTLTRAKITLPTVDVERREKEGVFIIRLYNFSAKSTRLFTEAFNEYRNSGYNNLLVDLRGNPGGYLDAAVQMAGLFLPEGKVVVKEIGKTTDDVRVRTSGGPGLFPETDKLIILVDKGSASASEILAGALYEHGIGTLVGEKTFGKGSVQELLKLTSDTSIKVTVAKWYTPNGTSISESGLTPKVAIPAGTDRTKDTQLETAIELFKKI